MATRTQVPVEEYLRRSFEGPDCDFVDGELQERNVGDGAHSAVQGKFIEIFYELRKKSPLFARPELRLKLAARKYRVADVAVFEGKPTTERYPSNPPLIVIEVVSPDDRISEIVQKLDEYQRWGVRHIWLVDPHLQKLYTYDENGLKEVRTFELPSQECGCQ